jgi:phosphate starvation-inducible protein PhoH
MQGRGSFERDLQRDAGRHQQGVISGHERDGLADAERLIKGVKGVSFNYFTAKDVVRHPLVARIIEAYERDDGASG